MRRGEVLRRLVHVGIGLLAFLVPVLGVDITLLCALVAIPANIWLLPRLPVFRHAVRTQGAANRGLWIYPAVVAGLLIVFHDRPLPAQCGWIALAFGDGSSPFLALMLKGGPRWPWHTAKRTHVSLAAGLVAAGALMFLLSPGRALVVGVGASLGEALPPWLDDNLSWPLIGAVVAFAIGGAA